MTTPEEQTVERVAKALSAFSHRPRGVILESARAAISAMPDTKALEAADRLADVMDNPVQSYSRQRAYKYGWGAVDDALTAYRAARGGKA